LPRGAGGAGAGGTSGHFPAGPARLWWKKTSPFCPPRNHPPANPVSFRSVHTGKSQNGGKKGKKKNPPGPPPPPPSGRGGKGNFPRVQPLNPFIGNHQKKNLPGRPRAGPRGFPHPPGRLGGGGTQGFFGNIHWGTGAPSPIRFVFVGNLKKEQYPNRGFDTKHSPGTQHPRSKLSGRRGGTIGGGGTTGRDGGFSWIRGGGEHNKITNGRDQHLASFPTKQKKTNLALFQGHRLKNSGGEGGKVGGDRGWWGTTPGNQMGTGQTRSIPLAPRRSEKAKVQP